MVKKFIGYIFTMAVIAVIVFTVLSAGEYKTMLPEDFFSKPTPAEEVVPEVEAEEQAPILLDVIVKQDSLEIEPVPAEQTDTTVVEN